MTIDSNQLEQMIDRILALSETMLGHANGNVWSSVAEISIEREPLVQGLAKHLDGQKELDQALVSGLERILEINQTLEALGQVELDRCAVEARKVMKGRQGVNAYTGA